MTNAERIQDMQAKLGRAYEALQALNMPPRVDNLNNLLGSLNLIKAVHDELGGLAAGLESEEKADVPD